MALWDKLKGVLGRRSPERDAGGDERSGPPATPAVGSADADESYLRALLSRLAGPAPSDESRAALAGDQLTGAVDRLVTAGRGRTAIELLRLFIALPEALHTDARRLPALRARLGELLSDRVEYADIPDAVGAIADDPEHGTRARFLLAEAAERAGDPDAARRHYELVLARDLDYPKARARHARLRPDALAEPAGAPTLAGLEADRTSVGDRYRLRSELGRGATSTVYLARDVELDRDVALKLVHPHASARLRGEARMRSWSEARIASALRHPGVVAIYDLDEERGLLAMELCDGGTLRQRLARPARPLPVEPREALRIARSLLGTLAAVHDAGVVHRDLKPGNLLFRVPPALPGEPAGDETRDELVLADFGLALFDEAATASRPAGTLDYLAPEARRGEPSAASDLYACGVILHELLTGERPGTREEILRGETPTLHPIPPAVEESLGAETAVRLAALLSSLLRADPATRPVARAAREALPEP